MDKGIILKKNSIDAAIQNGLRSAVDARAMVKKVQCSPIKVNLILKMIRKMHVNDAINALKFSKKKVAVDILKLLNSAIANAQNNYFCNPDDLYISLATVGKDVYYKRGMPRAKGRSCRIIKYYSRIDIMLSQYIKGGGE